MSAGAEAREPSARFFVADRSRLIGNFGLLSMSSGGLTQLRQLILSLAVQGKLAPQSPEDEPASALLARIRLAKRLSSAAADESDRPEFPPFQLPTGWSWSSFGDYVLALCTGPFGSLIHKGDYVVGGVPLINPSHMIDGRIAHDERVAVSVAMAETLSAYRIRSGDVLLARRGEVGRYALVTEAEDGWLCGTGSFFAKLALECDRRFFGLLLDDPQLRSQLQGESVGTTMTNLNQRILLGAFLAIPPLAEQARIVARVDELMRLCDALEEKGRLEAEQHARLLSTLLGTLTDSATPDELAANWQHVAEHFDLLLDRPEAVDELESNVLALAAQGRLTVQSASDESASALMERVNAEKERLLAATKSRPEKPSSAVSDAEQRFQLPQGWKWARLQDLAVAIVDCPHSTPKFVPSGVLCLDTNSFKKGQLLSHKLRFVDEATYSERIERLEPKPGDLVFAREGSVGESLIIPAGTRACLGQRVMLFRFSSLISVEYVRLAISSPSFLGALLELHKGIGAKHVNVGDMRQAVIPLPPLGEQRRIVERVGVLLSICATLRERLQAQQATQSRLAEALVEQALA